MDFFGCSVGHDVRIWTTSLPPTTIVAIPFVPANPSCRQSRYRDLGSNHRVCHPFHGSHRHVRFTPERVAELAGFSIAGLGCELWPCPLFHSPMAGAAAPTHQDWRVTPLHAHVTDAAWVRRGARQANLALVLQNSADLRQLFQGPPMTYLQ